MALGLMVVRSYAPNGNAHYLRRLLEGEVLIENQVEQMNWAKPIQLLPPRPPEVAWPCAHGSCW